MTRQPSSARALAEGALLADLTVVIVLVAVYVPYAGAALAAVSPLPFLLLILRQGWRISIQAGIIACLLISFLTGPLTVTGPLLMLARAAALGIGLRRGWQVGRTVVAGATFLTAIIAVGLIGVAVVIPAAREATEQGLRLSFREATGLAGSCLQLVGLGHTWARFYPTTVRFEHWFLRYWLILVPVLAWPVMLVAVGAEYVIAEVVLLRFGITVPTLRLPGIGPDGKLQPLPRGPFARQRRTAASRPQPTALGLPSHATDGNAAALPRAGASPSTHAAGTVIGRPVPVDKPAHE